MRRILLPLALLALTGTLVAQTPVAPFPLTGPDKFHCKVSVDSMTQQGDKTVLKNARLEFELGVTITADEAVFDKAHDGVMNFSGHVQMTLKH
jgi:hypothetical protein